jgi:hypothetical protein
MIHQICDVKTKTQLLSKLKRSLQSGPVGSAVKQPSMDRAPADREQSWNPVTARPYFLPISRWAE